MTCARPGRSAAGNDLAGAQQGMTWQVRSGSLIMQTVKANLPGLLPENRTCQVLQLILYLILIYNEHI